MLSSRISIPGALSVMLALSLACSMSLQRGHADEMIAATADDTKPLQAGQDAPRFTVRTVDNEAFDFDPQNLDKPVVLITFRGGWCPYCNLHLSELKDVVPEISAMGVDVLFLSGDAPGMLYQSLKRETQDDIDGLDYRILSDGDAQAAIALGIAFKAGQATIDRRLSQGQDIAGSSMMTHGVLPVPAVFAIGADGVIAYTFADPDYKVRLPASELLAVAKELVQ